MTHADQSYERGANAKGHDVAHGEPHASQTVYIIVAITLVFLTSLSYATQLPIWSAIIGDSVAVKRTWMMAVSCSKAMLVILFFMHLKWEANWKWVLTVPASLMSMLLVLALVPDVGRRFGVDYHAGPSRPRLTYAADFPGAAERNWNNPPRETERDAGDEER
jgi:heme/copper-type cytochrome/quinol oxidase subunit 4